jgi:hypothetical protein
MENKSYKGAVFALLGGVGAIAIAAPSAALAQDEGLPAVKNLNGKLSFGATGSDGNTAPEGAYVQGAVSMPLGHRVGLQLDFGADDASRNNGASSGSKGIGMHLFLRDPASYLVGIYAHRMNTDTVVGTAHNTRYGIEAEGYFGDLTVAGFIGQDKVDGAVPSRTFDAAELDFDYYFADNTMFNAHFETAFDDESGSLGITQMYDGTATPFAITASVGGYDGDTTFSLGATVYFGNKGMTLKQINRQNDPRIRTGFSANRAGYLETLLSGKKIRPPKPCDKCEF